MRLINTTTLQQHEFFDTQVPKYAILSHCWSDNEVTLAHFQTTSDRSGSSFSKISRCCELAISQDLEWAWIDTCCIDKTSSAELSEAINSMYRWYQNATICYVFLSDYDSTALGRLQQAENIRPSVIHTLSRCRWFSRGWTLQELVASREMLFWDCNDLQFGTKATLAQKLATITGINVDYLLHKKPLSKASVACRMSWASQRVTKRSEDIAYCLIGLFDVNMPLLYGEGSHKAFVRLQETIISQVNDESIFAWTAESNNRKRGMLAEHPREFANSRIIVPVHERRIRRLAARVSSKEIEMAIPQTWNRSFHRTFCNKDRAWAIELACKYSHLEETIHIHSSYDAATERYCRTKPAELLSFYEKRTGPNRNILAPFPFEIAFETITIAAPFDEDRASVLPHRLDRLLGEVPSSSYHHNWMRDAKFCSPSIACLVIVILFGSLGVSRPMLLWVLLNVGLWLLPTAFSWAVPVYFVVVAVLSPFSGWS